MKRPSFLPDDIVVATPSVLAAEFQRPEFKRCVVAGPHGFWRRIWESFRPPDPQPESQKIITDPAEIKTIFRRAIGKQPHWDVPADAKWGTSQKDLLHSRLVASGISRWPYVEDWLDCEDRTRAGRIELKKKADTRKFSTWDHWGVFLQNGVNYGHSVMGYITHALQALFRDNQNDEVFEWPGHWGHWLMRD
jgi:hypothetical protein